LARLAVVVFAGLLTSALAPAAWADEDPPAGDGGDDGGDEETRREGDEAPELLEVTGTVVPRFHIVDERGGEPSDTDSQLLFLRRARAQVELQPTAQIRVVVEAELMDPEPVRDAYARYRFSRNLELTAGHFKRPFGAMELDGVWNLLVSERGLSSEFLGGEPFLASGGTELPLTGRMAGRDFGAMLGGRWKLLGGLRWAAGAWNGEGDGGVGGRVAISPGPFTFGVSAGWNHAPADDLRHGAALGVDATLDSRWIFARVEGFIGSLMPVRHALDGRVINAQWAGGYGMLAARLPIPRACILLQPGGKVELLDHATDGKDDELILFTPFVRTDFGEHFRLLIEGNFLVAGDNAEPEGNERVIESFIVQLGARV
jgi:hypothetical protein